MLKPFDEKVEAAIEKLSKEHNPRGVSSLRSFYSAGSFQDDDGDDWSIGHGWRGHLDY